MDFRVWYNFYMPPEFLPSKKVMIAATALAVLIGWIFWMPTTDIFKLKNIEFGKKQQSAAEEAKKTNADLDADNDGLKDWEELLWRTDPQNSDSDSDGTPDGEEIKAGRSPATHGPDDLLSSISFRASSSTPAEFNLTRSISRALITEYLAAKNSNASIEGLGEKLLAQTGLPPFEDKFTPNDILIGRDDSPGAAKSYLNSVGRITAAEYKKMNGVLETFSEIQSEADYPLLDKLSADAAAYESIAREIKKLKAPASLASIHLDIINTSVNIGRSILEIQRMGEDVFLAMHGLEEFLKAGERSEEIRRGINAAIDDKNIIFSPSEPGYIFKQYENAES